jgi:type I restriction enzyme M protein
MMSNLTPVIKSIQDIMRQDVGVDGDAQRISQLTWLLFLKVFDALEEEPNSPATPTKPHPRASALAQLGRRPRRHDRRRTARLRQQPAVPHAQEPPADPVRNPRGYVVRGVFEDAYNYMKSGQLLRQVINKLNEIDFNRQASATSSTTSTKKSSRPAKRRQRGRVLHPARRHPVHGGHGQPAAGRNRARPRHRHRRLPGLRHRTPAPAGQNPEDEAVLSGQHPRRREKAAAAHAVRHQPDAARHRGAQQHPARQHPGPPAARLRHADRVDVVLTNPPFGGIEEPGIEQGFPADVRTKETADLFLVLIKHILKTNGRAAVVLPDGTLFGEGVKTRIKEQLLAECNLHTIVRLPNGVFAPYTGIKTNLLFFTKGQPTQHVWYYEHPYPAGVKSYNKTKPIRIEEFDAEKAWWGSEADGFDGGAGRARVENERPGRSNLDVIISVGYRVKSQQGTRFRQWATGVLRAHIVQGYSLNEQRLREEAAKLREMRQAVDLLTRTLSQQNLVTDTGKDVLKVIDDYAYALAVLDRYDHGTLAIEATSGANGPSTLTFGYDQASAIVAAMKGGFDGLFGIEKDQGFKSALGAIYQTYEGRELYPSAEEKAANLLYFIVKNHAFSDGNKRIAAAVFIAFLARAGILYRPDGGKRLADNALVALTLLIAESRPEEKDTLVKVTVNLINRSND